MVHKGRIIKLKSKTAKKYAVVPPGTKKIHSFDSLREARAYQRGKVSRISKRRIK